MKRVFSGGLVLVVLLAGSFFFQTQTSFAQSTAARGIGGGTLNGAIWESSSTLAVSVSDITTGSGTVEVDIGTADIVGQNRFSADGNGNAYVEVNVFGGCTSLGVRVYDGEAGNEFPIPIAPCTSVNSDTITQKYIALGGTSFFGFPVTMENPPSQKPGLYQYFNGGPIGISVIYWSSSTGTWSVHGAILQEWASLHWENSFLGFPITDETGTPDGIGRFNHFQGGSIYWTPSTGAHEVHGAIRDYWASRGWEQSCFGYPTTDEQADGSNGGRISNFQNGWIFWSPSTGILASC